MKKVEIYSKGFFYLSVCADKDLTIEEVEKEVNAQSPGEIWMFNESPKFHQGGPNPGKCEKDKNRKHYLFNC